MNISKLHYINLANGRFDGTSYNDLKAIFTHLKLPENQHKTLVLYFHGGCVSSKLAYGRISGEDGEGPGLLEKYSDNNTHPVFFVWESGPWEVIGNNLSSIISEEVFQKLLKRIAQFVKAKVLQTDDTRGFSLELDSIKEINREIKSTDQEPFAAWSGDSITPLDEVEVNQFMETLESDPSLQLEFEAIANGLLTPEEMEKASEARSGTIRASKATLMSPELLGEIREEAENSEESRGLISTLKLVKTAAKVLKNVIMRLIQKTDHGIYPTIAEELAREFYLANAGKWLWDNIKQETADAFGEDNTECGGTAFLSLIKEAAEAGDSRRMVLVGHSAGTIYISQFLQNTEKLALPETVKFDVVFLAGAATFDLVSETVKIAGHRINHFRSLALSDEKEIGDKLCGFLYPRSLLYIVSGVLEKTPDTPLIGMQRYFQDQAPHTRAKNPAIERVIEFMNQFPKSMIWADDDQGNGLASTAKGHTDFDNDLPTLESVAHIIQKGF